jgi:hypothetical protein
MAVEAAASRAPFTEAGLAQRGETGQIVVRALAETVSMKSNQRSLGEDVPAGAGVDKQDQAVLWDRGSFLNSG